MRHLLLLPLLAIGLQAAPWSPATVASWNTNLLNGLVAYWQLDEVDNGANPIDSWSTNNLVDVNTVNRGIGLLNNGLSSLQTGERILSEIQSPWTNNLNNFSVSVWVNMFTNPGTFFQILGCYKTDSECSFYLSISPHNTTNNSVRIAVSTNKTHTGVLAISIADTNRVITQTGLWWHCVGTVGDRVTLYINGEDKGSVARNFNITPSNSKFQLYGRYETGDLKVMAKLDEVGFWRRELTAAEVLLLYNKTNPAEEAKGRRFPFNSGP